MTETDTQTALNRLIWPLRLTLSGLWAERVVRAFWPLWSILIVVVAAFAFGVQDMVPLEAAWIALTLALFGGIWALITGLRGFHKPTRADALVRLDSALPGRPIAALTDAQALGTTDPASVAIWQAHRKRMADRASTARPVAPDLRLAQRDPYGLRYTALTLLVISLLFGSIWRVASVGGLVPGSAQAMANGPAWEGWAQPPAYTGKPAIYLNDIDAGPLALPTGTRIQVRMYGEVGDLTLSETVSGRLDPPPASESAQDFEVLQNGTVEVAGKAGRKWDITALPDKAPTILSDGKITREKDGSMNLPFTATDDYGVTGGTAMIAVDMAALDRRYGLGADPEPRDPLIFDLPLPISGNRAQIIENLIEDISKHPYSNLPVTITLAATDAAGQQGLGEVLHVVLPGKRFFDPLAASLIEMRRDILWSRQNAARSAQILKAVTHLPDDLVRDKGAYLRLRVVLKRLDLQSATLPPEARDEIAEELWNIALIMETGDLDSARERLKRAQDQLDEAIRNGADQAELDRLMQELRDATDAYMQMLADEAARNPDSQSAENQQTMNMTGNQIQEMMDELQKLIEEGKTAEAAQLAETLRQLMENMKIAEGGGGGSGGPQMPGQKGMQDLQQTLRDQQGLSDDSFSELQNGPQDGQQQGQQPGEQGQGQEPGQGQQGQQGQGQQGQQPGEGQNGQGQQGQNGQQQGQGQNGQGQNGQGADNQNGTGGQSLAQRQQALRDRLNALRNGQLPGDGSEQGQNGRGAIDDAGRAMDLAERALRDGDLSGALDKQAEAMEGMRQALRDLGAAMAQEQRQNGQASEGQQFGQNADPNGSRDPLGREQGQYDNGSAITGSRNGIPDQQNIYRRAQNLLEEIRRRSAEQNRPASERDYLRRLLDLF